MSERADSVAAGHVTTSSVGAQSGVAKDINTLKQQAGKASDMMRALSHETRLMILCMLCEQEMSVTEIEAVVKLPQASVSQQLARLRSDGYVMTRREGRMIYYRIADSRVEKIVAVLYDIYCKPGS